MKMRKTEVIHRSYDDSLSALQRNFNSIREPTMEQLYFPTKLYSSHTVWNDTRNGNFQVIQNNKFELQTINIY